MSQDYCVMCLGGEKENQTNTIIELVLFKKKNICDMLFIMAMSVVDYN